MNRSLPFLLATTCLAFGCAMPPTKTETEALVHDIVNEPRLACGEGEILYCHTTGTRIARGRQTYGCGCGPQDLADAMR